MKPILTFSLAALKFFRNLIGLQDEFYNQQMTQGKLFEPILNLVIETMPRDNLLNSACLEFFDFIKRENIKNIISHLVENYRDKLKDITYVDIFSNFIIRYDQTQGFAPSMETSFLDTEDDTPKRPETGRGNRWETGIKDLDAAEEEYFNTSDDEDDAIGKAPSSRRSINGSSPLSKPLVDYTSDDENDTMDLSAGILEGVDENTPPSVKSSDNGVVLTPTSSAPSPPEKVSEKRRREEEDEDEMSKLSQPKRRNSSSSVGSNTSSVLRKKKSFTNTPHGGGGSGGKANKIAITLAPAIKTGGDSPGRGDNSS
jgi:protein phosphatase-4 regulatory subunit 3